MIMQHQREYQGNINEEIKEDFKEPMINRREIFTFRASKSPFYLTMDNFDC